MALRAGNFTMHPSTTETTIVYVGNFTVFRMYTYSLITNLLQTTMEPLHNFSTTPSFVLLLTKTEYCKAVFLTGNNKCKNILSWHCCLWCHTNINTHVLHTGRVNNHIWRLSSFAGCLQKSERKATLSLLYGFQHFGGKTLALCQVRSSIVPRLWLVKSDVCSCLLTCGCTSTAVMKVL